MSMSTEPAGAAPLAHLRVVELTDLRGALAGRILADLGAEVIKVESPGGDPGRLCPPFAGDIRDPRRSLPFLFRNLGKRGAVIDLRDQAGWCRFLRLCDAADVLIENLAPDDELAPRLAAAVQERHSHLVHATIADFGRSGPRQGWRLEPLPAFAASGALWASGFPDRAPCWLPGYQAHDCAGILAVVGVLAALLDRARSGRGQTVEVSVQEAALAALDPWGIALADYARVYPALPPTYPRDADGPALVLPTADGYVRVLAVTPRHWRAFLALLANREAPPSVDGPARHVFGRGTWGLLGTGLERLAKEGFRAATAVAGALVRLPVGHQVLPALHFALAAVRRLGGEALASRSRAEVLAHGLRLGLPIAPVNSPEEFVAAAQTRARGYFRHTGCPPLDDAPIAPFPCRFSRTPGRLSRAAPEPGQDDGDFPRRAPPAPTPTADGPVLAGVRVINLGVGAVVPELCSTLADLGAEVVKIESAASLDFLRRLTPEPGHPNRSFMFNDENRSQRSVCLDLRALAGRELALRLCATADVVAENRQGGLLQRLGLNYEAVRRLRPDVVYVSSQGYGENGPLAEAPAFGPLAAAFAGATFLWNHPDAPYPGGSSLEHPDHMAGKLAAVAVLAALEHRRRTGEGQRIELAQSEATAYLLGEVYLEEPLTGRRVQPRGNAVDHACPHGVYPAAGADAWVAIAATGDEAWERMRKALGWKHEARLATLAGRLAARAEIDARVAAWTRGRSAEDAARRLQSVGVSAMAVQGPEDLRRDAHLAARGALVTIEDPEIGPVRHVATPIRLCRTPLASPRPAPRLGADTEDVLVRMLGLEVDEVRRLVAAGIAC
jgi:crotonobetainyl-CoA:carnitine CoA-transferase CaiB-like acyl-CoA transferase